MTKDRFNIHHNPKLQNASLLIGWRSADLGKVSLHVLERLVEGLGCIPVADLDPLDFFHFDGAEFQGNLVLVPESRFWASEKHNLLLFISDEPAQRQHLFLTSVLDFASQQLKVKRVYTVSGVPSMITHIQSRKILAVYNRESLRDELSSYEDIEYMDWEGPPGMSSYLLWAAGRQDIDGISLLPEVPFYLSALKDPGAIRVILQFLNHRFNLTLDLDELEAKERSMIHKLTQLREQDSNINLLLGKIEGEVSLNEQEQMTLTQEVFRFLSRK